MGQRGWESLANQAREKSWRRCFILNQWTILPGRSGQKWAYHLRPVVDLLILPHYETMGLARADGWDLVSMSDGSPWPWADLDLPKADVQASRMQAFALARQLIERRRGNPKRESRVEAAWDPERWEQKGPRECTRYSNHPPKLASCAIIDVPARSAE